MRGIDVAHSFVAQEDLVVVYVPGGSTMIRLRGVVKHVLLIVAPRAFAKHVETEIRSFLKKCILIILHQIAIFNSHTIHLQFGALSVALGLQDLLGLRGFGWTRSNTVATGMLRYWLGHRLRLPKF